MITIEPISTLSKAVATLEEWRALLQDQTIPQETLNHIRATIASLPRGTDASCYITIRLNGTDVQALLHRTEGDLADYGTRVFLLPKQLQTLINTARHKAHYERQKQRDMERSPMSKAGEETRDFYKDRADHWDAIASALLGTKYESTGDYNDLLGIGYEHL